MKIKLFFFLFTIGIYTTSAQSISPQIVSSAGTSSEGESIQLDWTLGELAISPIQNTSLLLTQGFHQPNYIITSSLELPETIGQISVYPNPTTEWITVDLNFEKNQKTQIQLYDNNGKLIWDKKTQGRQFSEKINTKKLPNGNYFLNVLIVKTKDIQTFKVQKIN